MKLLRDKYDWRRMNRTPLYRMIYRPWWHLALGLVASLLVLWYLGYAGRGYWYLVTPGGSIGIRI